MLLAAGAAILLAGLLIGLLIGRASKSSGPAPADSKLAQLAVTSKPVEANVVVDGRFVGISPVDRLDLEPGKHSLVIDAFGYQPYAGTVEVEAKGKGSLKVVLAPIGAKETTGGSFDGKGKSQTLVVPPTALLSLTGTGTSKDAPAGKPAKAAGGGGGYRPSRPVRDCSSEQSSCKSKCRDAETSCEFSCPGCSSCGTPTPGWDECNRMCSTCKQGCKSNITFCESSCDSNYESCRASNP